MTNWPADKRRIPVAAVSGTSFLKELVNSVHLDGIMESSATESGVMKSSATESGVMKSSATESGVIETAARYS